MHDIIDNRNEILIDHFRKILPSTERGKFAVGYLFLSGLKPIHKDLEKLKDIRLLIGNTTDRETLEVLAEGYKRLEQLEEDLEKWHYQRRIDTSAAVSETAENIQEAVSLMDQTDSDEATVWTILKLIQEQKLKVKVYTKGRLHAKAYIFDYGTVYDKQGNPVPREENGIGIVGSSNLTLAGLSHNTELNVLVHGNQNHAELTRWFEELWVDAHDFDEMLMSELKKSWAIAEASPYDIYMKTLYELVKEQLEEDEQERDMMGGDEIFRTLTDFQEAAVRKACQIIRDHGGAFVADVVGLGKSYVGSAIIKYFELRERTRPLIICPKGLVEMWERYNETYHLNARVVSMGLLKENDDDFNILIDDVKYQERDFIVVDESHHFRHSNTQRYRILQGFLEYGKQCLFLTATPRANSAWDVYHQIKLFHQEDRTLLPIDPPNLKEYFKLVDTKERLLQEALSHLLIRRTRNFILRWYGFDAETEESVDPDRWWEYREGRRKAYIVVAGKKQFFPKRILQTITYSIEDTYQGLYQEIRGYLGRPKRNQTSPPPDELTYARYGLWHYVNKEKQKVKVYAELHQAGANLRGLIRVLLFKRFESSVYAFRESLRRLRNIHLNLLKALSEGIVPAGDEAQSYLYESDQYEDTQLLDALRTASEKYDIIDFNTELLKKHIEQDIDLLDILLKIVEPITPNKDIKLQILKKQLNNQPLSEGKCLIFTQYADTARYLYNNLNPNDIRNDIDVIYSGDKSRERVVGRFAPKANPWFKFSRGESELQRVITTDVLAEGLNLQDCDKVINYDLHWNPIRLIQRYGRIDRIGSEHDEIFAFNFLPELGMEKQLGIKDKLGKRIAEIHETIGEDAAILDPSEQLNEESMYAIYEQKSKQLSLFEDLEEHPMDIANAEELFRRLKRQNPDEFERIASLRDGIRSGRLAKQEGLFTFFRSGRYLRLAIHDKEGKITTRNQSEVLRTISCNPIEPREPLPVHYNESVMKAKREFDEEVKQRLSQLRHSTSLTSAQRYVLREMRTLYEIQDNDEYRRDITTLEHAFRKPLNTAIRRELNRLKKLQLTGEALFSSLRKIYFQHGLKNLPRQSFEDDSPQIPRIICTEALIH